MTPDYLLSFSERMTQQLEGVTQIALEVSRHEEGVLSRFIADTGKSLTFSPLNVEVLPESYADHFTTWLQGRGWVRSFDPETGYRWHR